MSKRMLVERSIPDTAPRTRKVRRSVTVNQVESPLGWLHRHGHLDRRQFDAGEQLRLDWERPNLSPRITMRWDPAASQRQVGRGEGTLTPTEQLAAARGRFDGALAAAGPGMSDILWRIVCAGEGMRDAETALGWPARAGQAGACDGAGSARRLLPDQVRRGEVMKVFGSTMSPFVRKVLVCCAEKGIEVESVPVGIGSTDEAFRAASPLGKMPALVDGDFSLADSSAIVHYLEALHPEPALVPAEARARGRTIWWEEFADTILTNCIANMFFNRVVAPLFLKREGNLAAADRAEREELPPLLDYIERSLGDRLYLVGDRLTLGDIAIASPLANLAYAGVEIGDERPLLTNYLRRIHERESFSAILEREKRFFARQKEKEGRT